VILAKLDCVRMLLDWFQKASLAMGIQDVRGLVHNCLPVGNEDRQEAISLFLAVHSLANLSDSVLIIGLTLHVSATFWGLSSETPHSTNFLKIWIFGASGSWSLDLGNLRH